MWELLKIWQGLKFFNKSFQGWWVLASYHHPDSITWRWSVAFDGRNARLCLPKFGPSYYMGTKFLSPNGDFGCWLALPMIGVISLNTQAHMWRQKKPNDRRMK